MLRHPRAADPIPEAGRMEVGGLWEVEKAAQLSPICSPSDRPGCLDLPWALTNTWSPGASPAPSQLALLCCLSWRFCTYRGNAEALMEQIADNFQHLNRKIGTLSLPPNCWTLPSKTWLSQACPGSAPPPLAQAPSCALCFMIRCQLKHVMKQMHLPWHTSRAGQGQNVLQLKTEFH